jgi:NAD(P)-dependent dehydrogenase (short-subunit alcohol dehydrogenase family)
VAKYPDQLKPVRLDVTDQASIEESWAVVREQADGLELLINNAGVNSMSRDSVEPASHLQLGRLDPERMLAMFHINAIAPLMVVQCYLDLLKAGQEPRIVNISSWLGSLTIKTQGGNYSYCASKTALNMLTRCLAFDVLQFGIIAVMVNPGWVQTDMGGSRAALTPEQSVYGLLRAIDGLTPADAGRFIQWNGTEHPW